MTSNKRAMNFLVKQSKKSVRIASSECSCNLLEPLIVHTRIVLRNELVQLRKLNISVEWSGSYWLSLATTYWTKVVWPGIHDGMLTFNFYDSHIFSINEIPDPVPFLPHKILQDVDVWDVTSKEMHCPNIHLLARLWTAHWEKTY